MFMGNKTYQNYMSDADIIEVYKKDRKAGNEKMIEKYRDYIYYVIKKYYPTSITKLLICSSTEQLV